MKRIGYQLENVSLHYRGNQGLDLIFRTASGELAIVTTPTYAVVEAKHGKGLESLSKDKDGDTQGSPDYNKKGLDKYLRYGDGSQNKLVLHLRKLAKLGNLKSYAAFFSSNSLFELEAGLNEKMVIAIKINN